MMPMTSSAVPLFCAVVKAVVEAVVKVAVDAVVEAVLQRSSSQQYKAHVPLSPLHRAFSISDPESQTFLVLQPLENALVTLLIVLRINVIQRFWLTWQVFSFLLLSQSPRLVVLEQLLHLSPKAAI